MLAYEVVERQVLLPLVAACRRRWGDALAAVTLFGSWARGEQREFSEIDVLVVVDELPLGRWERQALVAAVTDDIDGELDELREREGYRPYLHVVLETTEAAQRFHRVYLDMAHEGKIVYDRGGWFRHLMDDFAARLAVSGAGRRRLHGLIYWDLAPLAGQGVSLKELGDGLMQEAMSRLETARRALAEADYAYTVRSAQEAVELSCKAVLMAAGVDLPKQHDVGRALLAFAPRLPRLTGEELRRLADISRRLRHDREQSMYGDEEFGLPPQALYTRADAEQALDWACDVNAVCRRGLAE